MSTQNEPPTETNSVHQQYILTAILGGKKTLVRLIEDRRNIEFSTGWKMLRWSAAGYWSSNGGGEITETEALSILENGKDVFKIIG